MTGLGREKGTCQTREPGRIVLETSCTRNGSFASIDRVKVAFACRNHHCPLVSAVEP